jgi:hypothetical protein
MQAAAPAAADMGLRFVVCLCCSQEQTKDKEEEFDEEQAVP